MPYISYLISIFLFYVCLFSADLLYAQNSSKSQTVRIDGSSTVFLITEAVAEEFLKVKPRIRVVVGVSGTGGGFKKFLRGETDITNASRKIKDSEIKEAKRKKVQYLEIPIAYDGISIVVNKKNDWVDFLTTAELKKIWQPKSNVKTWRDVRKNWPSTKMRLYGPGTDSGTFDYFTEAINGKTQASRSDFNRSEDDNILVQGVASDKGALGYFGYAYYVENKNKIKLVPVKHKQVTHLPTPASIKSGQYSPLSRQLFIYVNQASLTKSYVRNFLKFYLEKVSSLLNEVGYIPLSKQDYASSLGLIKKSKTITTRRSTSDMKDKNKTTK